MLEAFVEGAIEKEKFGGTNVVLLCLVIDLCAGQHKLLITPESERDCAVDCYALYCGRVEDIKVDLVAQLSGQPQEGRVLLVLAGTRYD